MKTRLTVIMLLLVLLPQCLFSCGKAETGTVPSQTAQTAETEEERQPEEERIPCGVPEDLKLDGRSVRMLLFSAPDNFSIAADVFFILLNVCKRRLKSFCGVCRA